MGWPPYALKWGGCWDVARRRKMPNRDHPSPRNKKGLQRPKWVRGVRHLCWTTEFLRGRERVNESVNVK